MYSRILVPPEEKSFFLFGPRGTGKTTWVKQKYPNAVYLDLLEAGLYNKLLAEPGRLESFIPQSSGRRIIIDEVQRIPELLNEVHRLIEKRKIVFVLTGSSARKLRRSGTNLLAGRALTYRMHPLCSVELGRDFDLKRSLELGDLPSIATEPDPQRYLTSYVSTYLDEEVRQEGLTRNIGAFARFLEAASFSQGSVMNTTQTSRECSVERKVVESYFNILEDLLIAHRVPVFTTRAKRKLIAHPKFYFFDSGVYRAIRPKGPLDRPEEIEGAALETFFLKELIALNDSLDLGYRIYYWRTQDGREVDFILYGKRGLRAFEMTRSGRYTGKDLAGLKAFLDDYPEARAAFIYGGGRPMREGNIEVLPVVSAIRDLKTLIY